MEKLWIDTLRKWHSKEAEETEVAEKETHRSVKGLYIDEDCYEVDLMIGTVFVP